MKRLAFFLLLFASINMFAQNYKVESFKPNFNDLTARENARRDLNQKKCALIKVQCMDPVTNVEGTVIGDVTTNNNESWVYVVGGTKYMKLFFRNHTPLTVDFSSYFNDDFDRIDEGNTYNLLLTDNSAGSSMKKIVTFNATPKNAIVLIDNNQQFDLENGSKDIQLPAGQHSYIVVARGCLPQQGQVYVRENGSTPVMNIALAQNQDQSASNEDDEPSAAVAGDKFEVTVNGIAFTMIRCEKGKFKMGASSKSAEANEQPVHSVEVSEFYIGETEVTQALYEEIMARTPSKFDGNRQRPVERISWEDCQEFIKRLNSRTKKKFSLPTEAQWEYAARGGNKSKNYLYAGSNVINNIGWCKDNSRKSTHAVKSQEPNELGLYDMSGNVAEWCQDNYIEYSDFYSKDALKAYRNKKNSKDLNEIKDPIGQAKGKDRVFRGGSWDSKDNECRTTFRSKMSQDDDRETIGFRLVLNP